MKIGRNKCLTVAVAVDMGRIVAGLAFVLVFVVELVERFGKIEVVVVGRSCIGLAFVVVGKIAVEVVVEIDFEIGFEIETEVAVVDSIVVVVEEQLG